MRFDKKGFFFVLTIVFVAMFVCSCSVMPHKYESGKQIKDSAARKVQPGVTTKAEIIEWFGVPTAIAKKGEKVSLPMEMAHYGAGCEGPRQDTSSETFFSMFSSKHKITDSHRIYYYAYTKSEGSMLGILFFNTMSSKTQTDKLLVLINEDTGIVEDYLLDRGK
ncbi:MAG: hypothetical protein PHE61_04015 [Candidatus Omnitrophica bacterium]|nr:hypothetical protein [Candidatus Omnitrophota bacterium]